jgi:phospholipid/cholesterol/gamma-HCH transport system substrate-binding protein
MESGTRSERAVRTLSGAIALIMFAGSVFFGIKYTQGDLKRVYSLYASFDTAGQGLASQSDVKIHGVGIGRVHSVKLVNGRAQVTMEINHGQRVPQASIAVVQPKTLFGEKFVDIRPDTVASETTGPFLHDRDTLTHTVGGIELEQVLSAAYPILQALDRNPQDLTVVLDTLARAGTGEGPAISRQIGNFQQLGDIAVAHSLDTAQLLSDLALLTNQIANASPDIIGLAGSLNQVLPAVNQRGDEVTSILGDLSRLSNDAANILNANRPATDSLINGGGQVLNVVTSRLGQVAPTIVGIRQFVEVLAEIGHIPYGNGSVMAAFKLVLGGGCPFGRVSPCSPGSATGVPPAAAAAAASATTPAATAAGAGGAGGAGAGSGGAASGTVRGGTAPKAGTPAAAPPAPVLGPQVVKGVQAIDNLVRGLLK